MSHGFDSLKDIIDVVVVPVTVALVAVFWPRIVELNRRRTFLRLLRRELEEVAPYPPEPVSGNNWADHHTKTFLHEKILAAPSDNRDFILSLPPELAYFVSQLWDARRSGNAVQWLHYLKKIKESKYGNSCKIRKAYDAWKKLIEEYAVVENGKDDQSIGG